MNSRPVSARGDHAIRAMLAIAADAPLLVKASTLARARATSLTFRHGILLDLRRAGLLRGHRGTDGGYSLTRAAVEITVGEVRATSGAAHLGSAATPGRTPRRVDQGVCVATRRAY